MSKLVREARAALIDSTRNADFLGADDSTSRGRLPTFLALLLAARDIERMSKRDFPERLLFSRSAREEIGAVNRDPSL